MQYNPQNPIIVQGDKSVLLRGQQPAYQEARDILSRFAELKKAPIYSYLPYLAALFVERGFYGPGDRCHH